jgi:hypothetical protein
VQEYDLSPIPRTWMEGVGRVGDNASRVCDGAILTVPTGVVTRDSREDNPGANARGMVTWPFGMRRI